MLHPSSPRDANQRMLTCCMPHAPPQCHEELVRANPTTHAYVMLGEAYMKISEPVRRSSSAARSPTPRLH